MIEVTHIRPADAAALAALHKQSIAPSWNTREFADLLASQAVFGLAAPAQSPWRAFILARVAAGEAEILTLVTAPAVRRSGHARALVRAAAAEAHRRGARDMFLEVAADNEAAIGLYAGLGFAGVGRRPGYYVRPGELADALTMRAALPFR